MYVYLILSNIGNKPLFQWRRRICQPHCLPARYSQLIITSIFRDAAKWCEKPASRHEIRYAEQNPCIDAGKPSEKLASQNLECAICHFSG